MSGLVLFVCTGNTCRSPLAEAMARHAAAERHLDLMFASAGTSAWNGSPASDGSILVGLERKLDLSPHRSRPLTRELVEEASLILGMGAHHVAQAVALGGAAKTHLLTDFANDAATGQSVHDPFGSELDAYRRMANQLDALIPRVIRRLLDDAPRPTRP